MIHFDGDRRVPPTFEHMVQQKPARPPISVGKRVYALERRMKPCCDDNGMIRLTVRFQIAQQIRHARTDLERADRTVLEALMSAGAFR